MSRFNTRSGTSLGDGLTHIGRWAFYYKGKTHPAEAFSVHPSSSAPRWAAWWASCFNIGTSDIITTTPSEDLNSVLKKFTVKNIDSLPVVADEDHCDVIGLLNRREVIAYYNERVQEMKALA